MGLIGALILLSAIAIGATAAQTNAVEVIFVVEGMETNDNDDYSFTFQRVDIASSTFLNARTRITFSGSAFGSSDELTKPETMETALRFARVFVEPGEYALMSRTHRRRAGRNSSDIESCYSYGAAIFAVREGRANLIVEDEAFAEDAQTQLQLLARAYPDMTQTIEPSERLGHVSFETITTPGQEGREYCRSEGQFSFRQTLPPTQPR